MKNVFTQNITNKSYITDKTQITRSFFTKKKRNSPYLKNYFNDPDISQAINNNSRVLNNITTTKEICSLSFNYNEKVLKRPCQKMNYEHPLKKIINVSNNTEVHSRVMEYIKARRRSQNENSRKQHLLSFIPRINKMNAVQHRTFCSQINVLIDGLLNTTRDQDHKY